MATQPSTREDEQVDEAAADVGKGPKPVLVTEKATGDARRRTPRSADIADWYRNADIGPGMQPILYHEKTTEDSLKRNVQRAEPGISLRKILRRIKRILVAGTTPEEQDTLRRNAEQPNGDARRRTPRSADIADWYRNADIGPGMQPILYHEKTTEDSLKRNLKPPEKRDKKPIAERFSSWLRQRRDRRADP